MNIDKTPLPAFLYQSLFGKNLVDPAVEIAGSHASEELKINFLGGNEKRILFLFRDPRNKYLRDDQMKFLYDLLTACSLNMADVALVNFSHNAVTYRELAVQLQARKILAFGIPAGDLDLPFTIPFFQIQNFHEQAYLLSPPITEIQADTEQKKQLWSCLRKIFNIQKQK